MLRWGIIGCGSIAHHFVKDLQRLEGHVLQAVASRSIDKAEAFGKEYNALASFGSYTRLLESVEVDIVYIATPHNSHMEWAINAMNAGKHVLCEKPLAVNAHEVQKMIDCAQKHKVFLMEALWSRFNPTIKAVKQICDHGDLGELRYLNAEFSFHREEDVSSRLFNPNLAGGALLDVGIYPIFLAYLILGYPKVIKASSQIGSTGVDLQTSIMLEYNESLATLYCGLNSDLENNATIAGTTGRITMPNRWHEAQGYSVINNGVEKIYTLPTQGRGFTYEILEAEKCILEGRIESPDWSHKDSLQLCTIMDEVRTQIGLKYPFE